MIYLRLNRKFAEGVEFSLGMVFKVTILSTKTHPNLHYDVCGGIVYGKADTCPSEKIGPCKVETFLDIDLKVEKHSKTCCLIEVSSGDETK